MTGRVPGLATGTATAGARPTRESSSWAVVSPPEQVADMRDGGRGGSHSAAATTPYQATRSAQSRRRSNHGRDHRIGSSLNPGDPIDKARREGRTLRRPDERFPRTCRTSHDATRQARACLVALSAMSASIPYASSCDGPPSAERHDAAIVASSIDSSTSSSAPRSKTASIRLELGVKRVDALAEDLGEGHLPRLAAADRLQVREHLRGAAFADQPLDGERHDPPRIDPRLELTTKNGKALKRHRRGLRPLRPIGPHPRRP